jgi:hypothetical protein
MRQLCLSLSLLESAEDLLSSGVCTSLGGVHQGEHHSGRDTCSRCCLRPCPMRHGWQGLVHLAAMSAMPMCTESSVCSTSMQEAHAQLLASTPSSCPFLKIVVDCWLCWQLTQGLCGAAWGGVT